MIPSKYSEFRQKIWETHTFSVPSMDGILCKPEGFTRACKQTNERFHKNNKKGEIKSHHYILSFDPKDKEENGLTAKEAQRMGMEFASQNFPGHQALVCTHVDGHNGSGNIHVHIVINSVRAVDVERQDFMERLCDSKAGNKHHLTNDYLKHLKQQVMTMCQKRQLYQINLLNPALDKVTEQECFAERRGQEKLVTAKNAEYEAYQNARTERRDLQTIYTNVRKMLNLDDERKTTHTVDKNLG